METRYSLLSPKLKIDVILHHYLIAALWTAELDGKFDVEQIKTISLNQAKKEVEVFVAVVEELLLKEESINNEQIGHDLWLSRNGHGTGFFDRDYKSGDIFQAIARKMGERNVFVEDDGIFIE